MTKPNQPNRRRFLCFAAATAVAFAPARARAERAVTVLFVCEHGYAKSLVAARHFARLARARGVQAQALSRGVDPGAQVPPAIAAGLAVDGFSVAGFAPSRVTPTELQNADYVVLISVEVDLRSRSGPILRWDDVSAFSENYARARSELVAHAGALLDRIQADGSNNE